MILISRDWLASAARREAALTGCAMRRPSVVVGGITREREPLNVSPGASSGVWLIAPPEPVTEV